MTLEFDALQRNGTWSLVPTHANMNIVGCKCVYKRVYLVIGTDLFCGIMLLYHSALWLGLLCNTLSFLNIFSSLPIKKKKKGSTKYKLKHKTDGSIEHYKAILSVKGFHKQRVDFTKTFSPTAKPTTN